MNVFDRVAKRRQKNRAASSHDADTYDYLRKEVRIGLRYMNVESTVDGRSVRSRVTLT